MIFSKLKNMRDHMSFFDEPYYDETRAVKIEIHDDPEDGDDWIVDKRDELNAVLDNPLGNTVGTTDYGWYISVYVGRTKTPEEIEQGVRSVFNEYSIQSSAPKKDKHYPDETVFQYIARPKP